MRSRILGRLAVGIATLAAALVPTLAAPPTPAAAATFPVYTNERSAVRPTLEQYGATRSTVVYDSFHFTCDTSAC
ncbi:hypothetical protein [Streptomyces sp. NPDC004685]